MKINLDKKQVLVDTALPSARVQELIEETGRKAVLFGVGVEQGKYNAEICFFLLKNNCYIHSMYSFFGVP